MKKILLHIMCAFLFLWSSAAWGRSDVRVFTSDNHVYSWQGYLNTRGLSVQKAVFDFDMSYYTAASEFQKNQIEESLRYFADTIYEASNGLHRLGLVRIYQNGKNSNSTNIKWIKEYRPCAYVNGYHTDGNIIMSDIFLYEGDVNNVYIYATPPENPDDVKIANYLAGGTLGHEVGHNIYGMYDEYELSGGDKEINGDSLMKNPDSSLDSNNFKALNFSTILSYKDPTSGAVAPTTEQYRNFGNLSSWQAIFRVVSADSEFGDYPRRIYPFDLSKIPISVNTPWSSLVDKTPMADAVIDISTHKPGDFKHSPAALSDLRIVWMPGVGAKDAPVPSAGGSVKQAAPSAGDEFMIREAVVFNVNSKHLTYVKAAVTAYVQSLVLMEAADRIDVVAAGETPYLVCSVSSAAGMEAAAAAINAVVWNPVGRCALYDGIDFATEHMGSEASVQRHIVLVSDAPDSGSSAQLLSIVSRAVGSHTVIDTVGFGKESYEFMARLAAHANGVFYWALPQQLHGAMQNLAVDIFDEGEFIDCGDGQIAPMGSYEFSFYLDNLIQAADISVAVSGAEEDVSVTITDEVGRIVALYIEEMDGYTYFDCQPDTDGRAGEWKISIKNLSQKPLAADFTVSGISLAEGQISLVMSTTYDSDIVAAGENSEIRLSVLQDGHNLTGFGSIPGAVFDSEGRKIQDIVFSEKKSDGVYRADAVFPEEGAYTVEAYVRARDAALRVTNVNRVYAKHMAAVFPNALGTPFTASFSRSGGLTVVAVKQAQLPPGQKSSSGGGCSVLGGPFVLMASVPIFMKKGFKAF